MIEYEWRIVTFPREASRAEVRRALVEHAEYGHWELHRTCIYVGGSKRAWLRRKIIRAPRASLQP